MKSRSDMWIAVFSSSSDGKTIPSMSRYTDWYSSLTAFSTRGGLGNYPLAFSLMERAGVVRDSIYAREKESRIREMATLFALNETELQLSRARSEAAHRQIMLIFLSVFAVAVLLIAAVLLIQYRRSQRRNRIASRRIDELTAQWKRRVCLTPWGTRD